MSGRFLVWRARSLWSALLLAAALTATLATVAGAHDFDHPAPPPTTPTGPGGPAVNSAPPGAWEHIATLPTLNSHTDLDYFTRDGETFASVGTLGVGANGAGQTLVQLTEGGNVSPRVVAGHPSAQCASDPSQALGLQHDVEATPKGGALLGASNPFVDRSDATLVVDATDNPGRCHDHPSGGAGGTPPQGGLELIDVTDPSEPEEIGLTSHIGESHTVNVDPKRPHIAYSVTSDAVGVNPDGSRQNENPADANDRFDLDGFEVVDMSSCMGDAEPLLKRMSCRPKVYRYRYPSSAIGLGHTLKAGESALYGCHELEIYPDDKLTCGGGNAGILFDVKNAFDDNGTPDDFSDDKPKGKPLPCAVRGSSSVLTPTGAQVTDCVTGEGGKSLTVSGCMAPGTDCGGLEGVKHLGSAHHQGRGAADGDTPGTSAFPADEDIDFDHEAELTESGKFMIATDERGGGVSPPGATCAPGLDNKEGNGGLHAYAVDRLDKEPPSSSDDAFEAYARTPSGAKAIHRAPIRTKPEATACTAHVFQQIPGQNRIFMGWYSQGTQVVDFVENADGTFEFKEAGYFIPENANEWVSHVFKVDRNPDGSFTYYGATGDFTLGEIGRNAIDVYKVTLPAPAQMAGAPTGGGSGGGSSGGSGGGTGGGEGDAGPPDRLEVLGAAGGRRCLPARMAVGKNGLGRVAVGLTRARLLAATGPPTRQTRRSLRYCVTGGGRLVAHLNARGRVDLVLTNARGHTARSINRGDSARALRGKFPGARRIAGRSLHVPRPKPIVFGTTRTGRVRFVAVVSPTVSRSRSRLQAALRGVGF